MFFLTAEKAVRLERAAEAAEEAARLKREAEERRRKGEAEEAVRQPRGSSNCNLISRVP